MGLFDSVVDKEYGFDAQTKWQRITNESFDDAAYYDYVGMNWYHEGDRVGVPDGEYHGIASWTFYNEPPEREFHGFKQHPTEFFDAVVVVKGGIVSIKWPGSIPQKVIDAAIEAIVKEYYALPTWVHRLNDRKLTREDWRQMDAYNRVYREGKRVGYGDGRKSGEEWGQGEAKRNRQARISTIKNWLLHPVKQYRLHRFLRQLSED